MSDLPQAPVSNFGVALARMRKGSGWTDRNPPRGMAGVAFWSAVWFGIFSLLRLLPGTGGTLAAVLQVISGVVFGVVAIPLLLRYARQHLLWSLRNKLVLTYLLVGLAPVILLVTLVSVCAYIAAGQFAIHVAEIRLQSRLEELNGFNWLAWQTLDRNTEGHLLERVSQGTPLQWEAMLASQDQTMRSRLGAYVGGVPLRFASGPTQDRTPLGLPPWATRLPRGEMQGIVLEDQQLFLVVVRQRTLADGRRFSLVSSVPVDREMMQHVAQDLGRAGLLGIPARRSPAAARTTQRHVSAGINPAAPVRSGLSAAASTTSSAATAPTDPDPNLEVAQLQPQNVSGGNDPPKVNPLDLRVRFASTLPAVDWDTGSKSDVPIEVASRPSRLYGQLFGSSAGGIVTRVLRLLLVVLCTLFAIIEGLALWMAMRLSRTVTASVTDLYEATQRIDRGDLLQGIAVERDDQMAELSRSFNRMMGSLQRLLGEQKQKQRLENELSIAQEVQANLFPHSSVDQVPGLELHGICRPARAVSGDYYDFLLSDQSAETVPGAAPAVPTSVGIAVGDISGKGISAALLMATLHSAIRAYQLAGEDLLRTAAAPIADSFFPRNAFAIFQSPGRMLSLLNRHLFRSTQPAKYATLFLAHYDAATAQLTYSNAGQLPPLVLCADNSVRRLDCGGTVVGLMDNMQYDQETISMRSGDIMVAYSDGVTEPENDFGDFGEERLMEVVRRYRDQPLAVISAQVMLALDAWIGAEEQPDDITLVLARQL